MESHTHRLVLRGWILLFTTPRDVVFYVCMGFRDCGWSITCMVILVGTAFCKLTKRAPSYASAADVMAALTNYTMFNTAPLPEGIGESLDIKK